MKQALKRILSLFTLTTLFIGLTSCGAVGSATNEYNELIALVQGVQSAASNFQLVTDTQYAKIQTKTQITQDYYESVGVSGEVWTGNFRSQAETLNQLLQSYRDANGNPLDPTKLNLQALQQQGALPDN